jgi:hypothetical protein
VVVVVVAMAAAIGVVGWWHQQWFTIVF